ncbi:MAG: hypothetical protein R6T89_01290 [Candidatus Syntrophosphaera sp.]
MYQVSKDDGVFRILKDGMPVFTPAGNPLIAKSEALAHKLAEHCERFGVKSDNWQSIVQFHFPMLDFFRHYPRRSIEQQLILNFDPFNDWTLRTPDPKGENLQQWQALFGQSKERAKEGRMWIATLNLNQLCAAMVLGKIMESMNIAYLVSRAKDKDEVDSLINQLILFHPELGKYPLEALFGNFLFYWEL